jgi:hypothetical protein
MSVPALMLAAFLVSPAGATTTPRHDVSDPAFDASFVRLVSGPSGGVVALWREKHGDDWRLYAAASDAGADALGDSSSLSKPGADALNAQAAMAANGASLAIWDSSDGTHQIIEASSRAPGGDWSEPQSVSAPGADAYHAQVAMGRGGSAVAVWSRSDGTRNVIQAAALPAGGTWGKPADLSDAANVTRNPQVAVGGDGTAVAVWERSDGDYSSIRASVLTPGGAWSLPQQLSVPGENATGARVAMDDAGDVLAIWRWYDGLNWIVASSFRQAGHDWQRVREVSISGFSAGPPGLAMNGSGRAVAIWPEASGVWTAQLAVDGRWSRQRRMDASGAGAPGPSVGIDATGDETAFWSGGGSLYGSFRASAADQWDSSQEVDCQGLNADICFSTYQPRAVMTGSGNAFAVWLESRNEHEVVASATYDNTTPPDTTDQSSDDELNTDSLTDGASTGVVVERTSPLLSGRRIRVTVRCAATRPCRGHLLVRRTTGVHALAGRSVRVLPGRSTVLLLRLTGLPRSVLLRGARLRASIGVQRARRGRGLLVSRHGLVIIGRVARPAPAVRHGIR